MEISTRESLFTLDNNPGTFVFVHLFLNDNRLIDRIELYVHQKDGNLVADVDRVEIEEKTKKQFKSYEKWCEHTTSALIEQKNGYECSIEGDAFDWSVNTNDVTIRIFSVRLRYDTTDGTINKMLTYSVGQRQQLTKLQQKQASLESDRQRAAELLTESETKNDYLQKKIYERFADVLNSKKEKIEQLIADAEVQPEAPILTRLSGSGGSSGKGADSSEVVDVDQNGADTDTEREAFTEARQKRQSSNKAADDAEPKKKARLKKEKLDIAPLRDKIPVRKTRSSQKDVDDIDDLV